MATISPPTGWARNISAAKIVSKDTSTAAEYLRQAADNGSAYAQYLLGKLTLMGEGVPKDMDAAYEWFAAARDNGHTYAEFFMKRMERGEQSRPPSCCQPPGCSTTWAISSGTTPRLPLQTVSKSTASGWRRCGKSASPSATSRTITSWNSNRDFR